MSSPRQFQIKDRFHITGRGTVVIISEITELPVGKALRATVTRPDKSRISTEAFKEWLLRHDPLPRESEAYLLRGIEKAAIPDGSFLEIELAE